ncbi:MAG: aa3-type cytochrome c oxidase subunit IV [Rhodobacteraceae bacterium]|nr:aa3-type cytochrome c oxidase subunit IV [Paracoccaceae bacterium]
MDLAETVIFRGWDGVKIPLAIKTWFRLGSGMGKHEHGSMDVKQHQRDFDAFVKFAFWVCVAAIAVLIFLAIFNS